MSRNGKILLAMSGGIDSSVSALLLQQSGYEVIGLTLYNWDYNLKGVHAAHAKAHPEEAIADAQELAKKLNIKHIVADTRTVFEDSVVSHFTNEYFSGHTPNPCVFCNKHVKWKTFLQYADELGCEFIATGHYAKIRKENNRFIISRGSDAWKDQSFVLWQLPQAYLSRTLFPIGHLTKEEIKAIAKENGWSQLLQKRESYNICFIPDDDYRSFLKERKPELAQNLENGNIVDENGNILGLHDGFPFYTIGQKKGLSISPEKKLYVKDINAEKNELRVAPKHELFVNDFILHNLNFVKYPAIEKAMDLTICIRGKDAGTSGSISLHDDELHIHCKEKVFAIMPGQSAVCYENNDLVIGGIVK